MPTAKKYKYLVTKKSKKYLQKSKKYLQKNLKKEATQTIC